MAEYIYGTDYRQYLQQRSFVADITTAQRTAARESVAAMRSSTIDILNGVERAGRDIAYAQSEAADRIVDAQREAAAILSADLARISDEIAELDSTFRWGFNAVVGVLGGMADTLSTLLRIAKSPAQTAAYEQFEIARDAFRQRLYLESLESLDKAISGDHTSPGYKLEWRFHQLIGIIRLGFDGCDVDLVDPSAAERAFLSAARYASADYPKEAARALMSAGWAAFVQHKLPEAVQHTQAALGLDPQLGEALFQAAKLQMVAGEPDAALPVLRRAIDLDRGYVVRAAGDPEFQRHGEALDEFLTALRHERLADLQRQIQPHYEEIGALLPRSSELADHPTVKLWQNLLAGGAAVVLTDLLAFDVLADAKAVYGLVEQLRDQVHFRMELVDVVREVEEVYSEEVVVRAAGWFRSEVKETVQRRRTVRRDAREGRAVLVNGLGENSGRAAPSPWVVIPPGRFQRGSSEVQLTRAFLVQATPVTQEQWHALMGNDPSEFKGPDLPVENVRWFDAVQYCNALSKLSGLEEAYVVSGTNVSWKGLDCPGFRLLTEAEWEFACRAGTTGERYGDIDAIAWCSGNAGGKTHPVAQKQPNAFGLYDMLGNVWEWCWDWYGSYPSGAVVDPIGPASGSYRVDRGGSWGGGAEIASAADRYYHTPHDRYYYLGFRLARSLP